jgi:hypothetical protein
MHEEVDHEIIKVARDIMEASCGRKPGNAMLAAYRILYQY